MIEGERRWGVGAAEELRCRCCDGSEFVTVFRVPSWRRPDWQEYPYGECERCGSLTLLDGVDPAPFYEQYERHRTRVAPGRSRVRSLATMVAEHLVFPANPLARWIGGRLERPEWLQWLAGSGLKRNARVLDVGAGNGALLAELERWGFRHLDGIDPYLPAVVRVGDRVRVAIGELVDVEQQYDLILFHHSLEHVDDPCRLLRLAVERLSGSQGRIAISLPLAEGSVWEEYRDNWAALDAPIHRVVPTMEGIRVLADRVGLQVVSSRRSCPEYHVVSSQLVSRRIPLSNSPASVLSAGELSFLRDKASAAHRTGNGPQVSVTLTAKNGVIAP